MKLLSQTALRGLLVAQVGFAALAGAGEFDLTQRPDPSLYPCSDLVCFFDTQPQHDQRCDVVQHTSNDTGIVVNVTRDVLDNLFDCIPGIVVNVTRDVLNNLFGCIRGIVVNDKHLAIVDRQHINNIELVPLLHDLFIFSIYHFFLFLHIFFLLVFLVFVNF